MALDLSSLTNLVRNFSKYRKVLPLISEITDAVTLRDRVVAAYKAAVALAGMTPTPADDAVLAYFNKTPDRFAAAVELIVDSLKLLGFEDNVDIEDGPFRGAFPDETDVRVMMADALNTKEGEPIKAKANEAGIGIGTLITVVPLIVQAIQHAPMLVALLKSWLGKDKAEK